MVLGKDSSIKGPRGHSWLHLLWLFIIPFLTIALCNCSPSEDPVIEYNVEIKLNNAYSNYDKIAKNNTDYITSISPYNKYLLSKNNISININDISTTNFTYSNNSLVIPKEEIKGNINVVVNAVFNENITKYEAERNEYLSDESLTETLKNSFDMLSGFELELLSCNYSNYALKSITCFREDAYNEDEWKIIAGSSSSSTKNKYNTYKNTFTKEKWLSKGDNFVDKESKEVDFYHLLAVLNTYLYTSSKAKRDLSSFGGDIVQYVISPSYFASQDLLADIDGANLYYYYKNNKYYKTVNGISLAFINYYKNISLEDRKKMFIENELDSSLSYDDQVDELFSRLSNNLYLIVLCEKYGISFSTKEIEFKNAIKYFLTNLDYK